MTTTALTAYRPSLLGRNVFDDLFGDFSALMNRTTQGYPVADIYRNEQDEAVMEFALAGFKKENLHVEIYPDKKEIHVSSDSHGDEELACFNSRRIARRAFHKTYVNYDNNLDLGAATANFENGLLRLVVPTRAEAKPLAIDIK
jgi:HSP20 family molecular chaperone IbpA